MPLNTFALQSIVNEKYPDNAISIRRYLLKRDQEEIILVYNHYRGKVGLKEVESWAQDMETIIASGKSFVVMTENAQLEDFEPEGRKHQVLWFKQNKPALAECCLAIVRVARDDLQAEKLARPQLQKAFPFPLIVVENPQEGFKEIEALKPTGL